MTLFKKHRIYPQDGERFAIDVANLFAKHDLANMQLRPLR
jgi:hypothetical protein